MSPPRAFLTDFGLAKTVATGSRLTKTGETLGTPAYMSPEQARGEVSSLTPATDVWSLGCVLHEMLAGRTPFEAGTPAAVIGKILLGSPAPLRRLAPAVPSGVSRVVNACLSRSPSRRYATARALAGDLDRALRGERPRGGPPQAGPRLALGGALAAVLATAAGSWALRASEEDRAPAAGAGPGPEEGSPAARAGVLASRARDRLATDPAEASRLLEEALRAAPGDARAASWELDRGLALWFGGRDEAARGAWRRIGEDSSSSRSARLCEGIEILTDVLPAAARDAEIERRLRPLSGGEDRAARLARAVLGLDRGEWSEARRALADVEGWEAALLRGFVETWDPKGTRELAVREFDRALASGVRSALAYTSRGQARAKIGDTGGAMEDYTTALRLRPGYPRALSFRGAMKRRLGDRRGALEDQDAAIRARPDYPDALAGRGLTRLELGDPVRALEDHERALLLEPGTAEHHLNRGMSRRALGDETGAFEDFEAALRLDPEMSEAWYDRGTAHARAGRHARALADFDAALRLRPDYASALGNRGNVHAALGNHAAAVADFSAILRLRSDDAMALGNRALSRQALGDLPGALEDLETAVRLRPDVPGNLANLALVRCEAGDVRRAAQHMREFLKLAPEHPRAAEFRTILAGWEERLAGPPAGGR